MRSLRVQYSCVSYNNTLDLFALVRGGCMGVGETQCARNLGPMQVSPRVSGVCLDRGSTARLYAQLSNPIVFSTIYEAVYAIQRNRWLPVPTLGAAATQQQLATF